MAAAGAAKMPAQAAEAGRSRAQPPETNGARLKRYMGCVAGTPDLSRLATTADAHADPFALKQRLADETRSGFRLGMFL